MRNTFFLTLLGIQLIVVSCGKKNEFTIHGTVKDQAGKTIFLQKFENNAPVNLDSAKVGEDGSFHLSYDLPGTDFYQITLEENNTLVFIGEPGADLEVISEKTLYNPLKTSGSEDTRLLLEFGNHFNALMKKRDSIAGAISTLPQMEAVRIATEFQDEVKTYVRGFIDKHPSSPASMAALSKLNPVEELPYFKKVRENLSGKMRTSPYFTFLEGQILEAEQQARLMEIQQEEQARLDAALPEGSVAPEISMEDPSGRKRSLSDLRGKVVLIDFWASWCGPCRRENPNLVNAYAQFKGKGFEVFSVSLDKNAEAWKNAIRQDGLKWTYHVSDLQHWNSAAAKKYGVTSIPFALLIDKDGKIIAKNLRGEALTEKLKEILG